MTAKTKPTSWKGCFSFSIATVFFSGFLLCILLEEKSTVSYHHNTRLCLSLPAKILARTALCRTYREAWRPWGHFCLLLFRLLKSFSPTSSQ